MNITRRNVVMLYRCFTRDITYVVVVVSSRRIWVTKKKAKLSL
jgi:hypothetical protein